MNHQQITIKRSITDVIANMLFNVGGVVMLFMVLVGLTMTADDSSRGLGVAVVAIFGGLAGWSFFIGYDYSATGYIKNITKQNEYINECRLFAEKQEQESERKQYDKMVEKYERQLMYAELEKEAKHEATSRVSSRKPYFSIN